MQEDLTMRNEENVESVDYIDAIKGLKEQIAQQAKIIDTQRLHNKKLLDTFVNGQQVEQEAQAEVDINQLRKDLVDSGNMLNLEYAIKALELRNAVLEKGGEDPFVPQGEKIVATNNDYITANKVATVLQEMIDVADGNPNVFLNECHRRIK